MSVCALTANGLFSNSFPYSFLSHSPLFRHLLYDVAIIAVMCDKGINKQTE